MTIDRRLRVVADRLRPTTCYATGAYCETAVVCGDETPGDPDLPARCPTCGRPRRYQIVRLVGVDASKL